MIAIGLGVVTLLVGSLVVAGTMTMNNLRVSDWKQDLFDLAPPSGARVVARGTDFGLLGGNSNHCDKRAWILLDTGPSPDEVEQYYTQRLETNSVWIMVSVDDASRVRVEMFEPGTAAGWDPRCH